LYIERDLEGSAPYSSQSGETHKTQLSSRYKYSVAAFQFSFFSSTVSSNLQSKYLTKKIYSTTKTKPSTMTSQEVDPNMFTTPFAITPTTHRDPYPAILPTNSSNSQADKIIIITGGNGGIGAVSSTQIMFQYILTRLFRPQQKYGLVPKHLAS
jgi:hypothetical protein